MELKGAFCPECGGTDGRVLDSRVDENTGVVKRRRQCFDCESRFTTYEISAITVERFRTVIGLIARLKRVI